MVRSPAIDKWASEFFKKELPLLREIYLNYKIPPAEIVEAVTLCKFSPVPATYPPRLRNTRGRKRLAAQFKKTAAIIDEIRSVNGPVWNVDVFNQRDIGLELRLEELASRSERQKPPSGRPGNQILRECTQWLAQIFQKHTKKGRSLRGKIDELLAAAFPITGRHTVRAMNVRTPEKASSKICSNRGTKFLLKRAVIDAEVQADPPRTADIILLGPNCLHTAAFGNRLTKKENDHVCIRCIHEN